ncbi:MAG TPA: inosine/xanthosine triphosphatase [Melioribacteraceae bacterium]|nr:inosine/xanthosine triphosphatase [Melioribacteraceae bacterium]
MNILVGSLNPVKIESVKTAFSKYFDNITVKGINVKSNVPNQPINKQTFEGAKNRCLELINNSKVNSLIIDYYVGIEGGISELHGIWFSYGCVCIASNDNKFSFGTSPLFMLPNFVVERLLKGEELGSVMDELYDHKNSKQNLGAIGFLTKGVMNRTELYTSGVITALIPFINEWNEGIII